LLARIVILNLYRLALIEVPLKPGTLLQRIATPDEITDGIDFLVGNPNITGNILALDGGAVLK
jgi:NAD(P)-dependent dehydrogenase (short-subunit alcohol dehydrogenase family)